MSQTLMPICFLSGPCRRCGCLSEELFPWIRQLVGKGWSPLIPVEQWLDCCDPAPRPLKYEDLMAISLAQLVRAEAAVFLPRWEKDELSRILHEFARLNQIAVFDRFETVSQMHNEFPRADEFGEKWQSVTLVRDLRHAAG